MLAGGATAVKKLVVLGAAAAAFYAAGGTHAVTSGARRANLRQPATSNAARRPAVGTGTPDQGVDYQPAVPEPVRAVGAGVVVYSSSTDCLPDGWPGCSVIGYKLTAGQKAGAVIYVAEHLSGLLPAGADISGRRPDRHRAAGLPVDRMGVG